MRRGLQGQPRTGRRAWVVADDSETPARWEAGPLGRTTNNVAELTALEKLLTAVDPGVPLEIRMDSQYAMKAVTTWLPGWKRNNWKTAAGKPVANQELVVRIDALLDGRSVEFRYVPAHQVDGDRLNDFADRAASQAATVQEPAGSDLGSPEPPPSPDTPKARARSTSRRRHLEVLAAARRGPSRPSSPGAACAGGPTRPASPSPRTPRAGAIRSAVRPKPDSPGGPGRAGQTAPRQAPVS
ncbi:Ribonuclease H [Streptomyces fumanus]